MFLTCEIFQLSLGSPSLRSSCVWSYTAQPLVPYCSRYVKANRALPLLTGKELWVRDSKTSFLGCPSTYNNKYTSYHSIEKK